MVPDCLRYGVCFEVSRDKRRIRTMRNDLRKVEAQPRTLGVRPDARAGGSVERLNTEKPKLLVS